MKIRYLGGEYILFAHSNIIDKIGGLHGVRDINLFLSLIEKPKGRFGGKELYKGIFTKAAVYLEGFARYHVFIDGNKRTAFVIALRFLYINGYELDIPQAEVENFVLDTAVGRNNLKIVSAWLKKYA